MTCLTATADVTQPTTAEEGTSSMTVTTTPPEHEAVEEVVGGIDTHADTIHVAIISTLGRDTSIKSFPPPSPGTGPRATSCTRTA